MQKKLFLGIAAAILMSAPSVYAQGSGPVAAACKADIDTLCKDAEGSTNKCLRKNEAKISAECKTALDTQKQAREAVKTACKADTASLCKDAGDERGAGMKCLRDNVAKVSPDCSKALAAVPAH